MSRTDAPTPRSPVDLQLGARIAYALPAAALLVAAILAGGVPFAVLVAVFAAMGAAELARLAVLPPPSGAIAALAAALVTLAALDGRHAVLLALVATLPLAFFAGAAVRAVERRGDVLPVLALAGLWIGGGLAHGVLLRELEHGATLVTLALLATFVGDTAAHVVGSRVGRHPLIVTVSPRKTLEGLGAGVVAAAIVGLVIAAIAGAWLRPIDGLALGLVAGVAAPLGDLTESMFKRAHGAKDSGALLGPHGGVLDRIDAVLFTSIASYYLALALL